MAAIQGSLLTGTLLGSRTALDECADRPELLVTITGISVHHTGIRVSLTCCSRAIVRVLHWVAAGGFVVRVAVTMVATYFPRSPFPAAGPRGIMQHPAHTLRQITAHPVMHMIAAHTVNSCTNLSDA